ncbi:hypothetical protein JTE90_020421 [Oedothorax gibbosus]|uniref:MD-2-related lipid-recognition domain-containing protein n=1 Tax=Oedothorax gibbosus TaxID=931172 RepID=A0AAV6UGV4_9ARAC|nr:hypothetical protein JTE90_020421 [Oedothorax gibbosus]
MKAFLICLLACVALSTATKFEDCGSKQVTVKKVDVQDCPDGPERCTLEKDATKSISIVFEATNSSARGIKVELYSWQNGFPWMFDDDHHDGCKGHGLQCPLKIGDTYTYTGDFYIMEGYPTSENVVIQWEMIDENNKNIMCVHVPRCKRNNYMLEKF